MAWDNACRDDEMGSNDRPTRTSPACLGADARWPWLREPVTRIQTRSSQLTTPITCLCLQGAPATHTHTHTHTHTAKKQEKKKVLTAASWQSMEAHVSAPPPTTPFNLGVIMQIPPTWNTTLFPGESRAGLVCRRRRRSQDMEKPPTTAALSSSNQAARLPGPIDQDLEPMLSTGCPGQDGLGQPALLPTRRTRAFLEEVKRAYTHTQVGRLPSTSYFP